MEKVRQKLREKGRERETFCVNAMSATSDICVWLLDNTKYMLRRGVLDADLLSAVQSIVNSAVLPSTKSH